MLTIRSVKAIFAVVMMGLGSGTVSGQTFPNKPIRIIAAEAGAGTDFVSRLIAQGLAGGVGQPVIVENRPQVIGMEILAKAQPDGYTLYVAAPAIAIPGLTQPSPYELVRDYAPITTVSSQPNVLVVHPSVAANSVKELIALAKARPGEIKYGGAAVGSGAHLSAELFKAMAGVNILRVPYKAAGPSVIGLLSNEVQMMIVTVPSVMPHVKSGKLKGLAVTSAQPSALAPGLPTMTASGLPGYEVEAVYGMFAPAKTPEAVIKRLNQEVVRVLSQVDVKEKFFNGGVEAAGSTPDQLTAKLQSDIAKWSKLIKEAGIRAE